MTLLLLHEGESLAPHDVWGAWTQSPLILGGLLAVALLYWLGGRDRRRRGRGRRDWHAAAFWLGWGALVLALVSPLHALGEVLF